LYIKKVKLVGGDAWTWAQHRDGAGHRVTASIGAALVALLIVGQDLLFGPLDGGRLADVALAAVVATWLDEGRYHGSIHTVCWLSGAQKQTGLRRRQQIHLFYAKPEFPARAIEDRRLIDGEVAKTPSRLQISEDNLYSEPQFKTLKYRADFPRSARRLRSSIIASNLME
jgi:hypothetical protein